MDFTKFSSFALQCTLIAILLQSCTSQEVACKNQRLKFCAFDGIQKTPLKNLVGQSDQKQVVLDQRFKDLELLSKTGCSDLVKPFACSIFAPVCVKKFGLLPPCKSLCETVKSSCKPFLALEQSKFRSSKAKLDCSFFPNPGKTAGCVDWSMKDYQLVMTVRGTPTVQQWKNRALPTFYQ